MEPHVSALERRLEEAAQALDQEARASEAHKRERDQAMSELVTAGVGLERIASLAGITKGRVSQIVKRARANADA